MIGVFDPGDRVFLDWTFTKAEGQTGNPASVDVALTILDPTGGVDLPPVSASIDGAGVVTAEADIDIPRTNLLAGMWWATWELTGDIIATEEQAFYVRASAALALETPASI